MSRSRVFEAMGTVVSLTVPEPGWLPEAPGVVSDLFRRLEETYSLYRPDSELSRINRGELALTEASEGLLETYAAALEWRAATGGVFTPHRGDGAIDLNGVVKAMAIRETGEILRGRGADDWCLNVGGDVLCSGVPANAPSWTVGIVDPFDRARLLFAVDLVGGRAVATSGSAERGDHIWRSGDSPSPFVQVTVVADDIVTADVLATAIVAGGRETLDLATGRWAVDVLTVDRDGGLSATPGLMAALA